MVFAVGAERREWGLVVPVSAYESGAGRVRGGSAGAASAGMGDLVSAARKAGDLDSGIPS